MSPRRGRLRANDGGLKAVLDGPQGMICRPISRRHGSRRMAISDAAGESAFRREHARLCLHRVEWLSSAASPASKSCKRALGRFYRKMSWRDKCRGRLRLRPTTALRAPENYGLRGWISAFSRSGPAPFSRFRHQAVWREADRDGMSRKARCPGDFSKGARTA